MQLLWKDYCNPPYRILRRRTFQCCANDDMIPKNNTQTHKHISTQAHTNTHMRCFLYPQDGHQDQSIWPHLPLFDATFRIRCFSFAYKCETVHFPHQRTVTQDRPIKMHSTVLFTVPLPQVTFIATTAKHISVITCMIMTVGQLTSSCEASAYWKWHFWHTQAHAHAHTDMLALRHNPMLLSLPWIKWVMWGDLGWLHPQKSIRTSDKGNRP